LPSALKTLFVCLGGAAFALMAGLVIFAASISHYTPGSHSVQVHEADGIVVLTGGEQRVREGLKLFHHANARRILISGVNRQTTREDLRRRTGLPGPLFDCCVDIGYEAQDTTGNADETRDWAATWGFQRLLVVTSNYHMPRGLTELSRTLPDADLVPHPVISRGYHAEHWWMHPSAVRLVVSEYAKYLHAAARLGFQRVLNWTEPKQTFRAATAMPRARG
jgi:uncharacterized SAM-binding protein YcdF (DUF218 family)